MKKNFTKHIELINKAHQFIKFSVFSLLVQINVNRRVSFSLFEKKFLSLPHLVFMGRVPN